MRGKGVMGGLSQPKSCSRKKSMKSCNMKGKFENVVLIDVDGYRCENVIIIDAYECVEEDLQGSSGSKGGKQFPSAGVISIDDDETDNMDDPVIGVETVGDLDSDASSRKSCPAPNFMRKSAGLDDDDCWFVKEKKPAFKLSKCKKTYTGKTPCGKRFGLSPESEDSSSESDCSDCELMEGSVGKLQEQWEKAFQRKKCNIRNGQSGLEDRTSASGSKNDTASVVEEENKTQKHAETPASSGSSESNIQKQKSSAFETNNYNYFGGIYLNRGAERPFVESNKEVDHGSFSKLQEQWEKAFQRKKCSIRNGQSGLEDWTSASGSRNDTAPVVEEENKTQKHAETPASSGSSESNIQKQKSSAFETNNYNYFGGTYLNHGAERPFVESNKEVDHGSFSQSKYGPTSEAQFSDVHADVMFGRDRFMKDPLPRDRNQEFCRAPLDCNLYPSDMQHGKSVLNGKRKLQSKEPSMPIPKLSEVDDGLTPSDVEVGTVFDESASVEIQFGRMPVASSKTYCDREKVVCGDSSQNEETQIKQSFHEAEQSSINSMSSSKKYEKRDTFNVQGVDASGEKDIIIGREKLKETYEYKRAEEEEWASRQRELKIQAEEAQRLRKRRKAESMRLLDMERRQKQRLEEMRETQKKDEENLNLKERLRIEIRKELSKLEISCIDMASLLRSLGIPVDGGFRPLPNEVHAAYKRALLRFHPDRASKTNIRQQVEAEEKFKLISRMKEKFLATSCH